VDVQHDVVQRMGFEPVVRRVRRMALD
jgi:hypothetical protein